MSNDKKVQEIAQFFEDEKKNKRFQEYVEEMEGKKISSRLEHLSYEEAEQEREEFEGKYNEYLSRKEAEGKQSELKEAKVKLENAVFQISREVEAWRPSKLLCKRFNVLMPYTNSRAQPQQESYF
jgi:lipase chaperone LimK